MISSFAFAPARGAKIVVMGDEGMLVAEQTGPNPAEDGVVIGSHDGAALAPLPTPAQYTPFTDARDHRLMAFRLLVREFNAGIERGVSPPPNFDDGMRCQEVLDAVREAFGYRPYAPIRLTWGARPQSGRVVPGHHRGGVQSHQPYSVASVLMSLTLEYKFQRADLDRFHAR